MNTFEVDGLEIIPRFLSKEQIFNLRKECIDLFKYSQIMGPGYAVRLNKYVSEVPNPLVKIESVNLMEVAINISDIISKKGFKKYKLAHVALYNEIGNPNELIWHSDLRNGGLIRAQICVDGGQLKSGAFRYIKGSHLDKNIYSEPTAEYLTEHKNKVQICDMENGGLFLINTIGYHSKCTCLERRISFMFDFLPADYIANNLNDVSSDLLISVSRLTSNVLKNIDLFCSGVQVGCASPNTSDNYKFYKPFAGSGLTEIMLVSLISLKRKFLNFKNKLLNNV